MNHPITGDVRLAGRLRRIYCRLFAAEDPRGWADYHIVPERRGTLWLHCHGARRRAGADLEFVAVPPELRDEVVDLMIAILRHARAGRRVAADAHLAGNLISRRQSFTHLATLRSAPWNDKRHRGLLRIVDYDAPAQSGFPRRLLATHVAARAESATDPATAEALYRRSIEVFAGDFGDEDVGAQFDPEAPDITALQNRSNLAAYVGLARILADAKRLGEASGFLEAAIARCPGWALGYRDHLMQSYRDEDPYLRYWKDANIAEITMRRRAEARTQPGHASGPGHRPGFGRRPRGVADFL